MASKRYSPPRSRVVGLPCVAKRYQKQRADLDVWPLVDDAIRRVAPRMLVAEACDANLQVATDAAEQLSYLPELTSEADVLAAKRTINDVRTELAKANLMGPAFELLYAAQKAYRYTAKFLELYEKALSEHGASRS